MKRCSITYNRNKNLHQDTNGHTSDWQKLKKKGMSKHEKTEIVTHSW